MKAHPSPEMLSDFALGKLDDAGQLAVSQHIERCDECRGRVGAISSDSFLDRFRDVQSVRRPSDQSRTGTRGATKSSPLRSETLPPGLAENPDYEIKRELGRGGMGVVYLAHNKLMGRDEVLKVLGQHIIARRGILDRFLREIRAVAKLRHQNIVTAYSASRIGESLVFSMEYVDGLDLARMVKAKGPLPVAHACNFVHQAALGLQHAHEEGLVHRDIKPANLMLARKGTKATIKVLDFGLAKATREEKVDTKLTSDGQALGTPDFIAPEQIRDAQSADIRADIYSLGGTLFYLLTGRPPFQATSLYDLYQAHFSSDAEPLNLLRPEVPTELAALVSKMMAKEPDQRFQTPAEVAAALVPFFKTANANGKRPEPEISQFGKTRVETPISKTPAPIWDQGDPRAVHGKPVIESAGAESRWESLVDFSDADEPVKTVGEKAGPTLRRSRLRSLVAVGMFMLASFAAFGVYRQFSVRTSVGDVKVSGFPADAKIFVDGDETKVYIKGKLTVIRVVPGKHKIEIKKNGFSTFTEKRLSFRADGSEEITVELTPLPSIQPSDLKSGLVTNDNPQGPRSEPREVSRRPKPEPIVVEPKDREAPAPVEVVENPPRAGKAAAPPVNPVVAELPLVAGQHRTAGSVNHSEIDHT